MTSCRSRSGAALIVALLIVAGCSGGNGNEGGDPSTPTAPTGPPPPSGVALIAGNWTGTSDFQQNGIRFIANTTATFTQNDRGIAGTVRFTSPGWEGWQATVAGTLAGTAPDTQFVGNVVLQSPSATGTGVCNGQMTMAGPSVATSMRWEAPTLTMSPNVTTQPASACQGTVFTVVWIFTRR